MVEALRKARQRLMGFLLRHGRSYDAKRWTWRHREWLMDQPFPHPAQQVACQEYLDAANELEARVERLTGRIRDLVPAWSMAPVVEALQAMRGASLVVASALVAEVGDMRRFDNPRQLMAYLGLVPSEHSSGSKRRQGAITKAGSPLARRMLVEGAWTYRLPARVSAQMRPRLAGPAAGGARHRLESAAAPLRPLPPPARHGQAAAGRRHGDRARDGGLRLGPRAHGRAPCRRGLRKGTGAATEERTATHTRRLGEEVERSGEPSADTTGRPRADPRH